MDPRRFRFKMSAKENERAQIHGCFDDPERGRLVTREVEPGAPRGARRAAAIDEKKPRGPERGSKKAAVAAAESKRGESKRGESKRGESKRGESKRGESTRGESKRGESTRGVSTSEPSARVSPPRPPDGSPVDGRTRRRLETRERVRQAAFELFVRDGFERTTTGAIAKRAGVAAGTIFLHAPDKADLLFLVMHDRLEAVVEERARDLPDGPLLDRLMHLFDGLFRMYGEYPGLAADFVRHLPGADGPNARRVSTLTLAFLHRLAMLVVDAQRRGEVAHDVDLLTCSRNLFGLYFVALLTWLSGQVTLEGALVPTLRDSLALQIRGLRA